MCASGASLRILEWLFVYFLRKIHKAMGMAGLEASPTVRVSKVMRNCNPYPLCNHYHLIIIPLHCLKAGNERCSRSSRQAGRRMVSQIKRGSSGRSTTHPASSGGAATYPCGMESYDVHPTLPYPLWGCIVPGALKNFRPCRRLPDASSE
jgi:hypothetical protein